MYVCTSWKARPLTAEQSDRLREIWLKAEADAAANPIYERLCWFVFADGSGGFQVIKTDNLDETAEFGLEITLALAEFLEFDTKIVLDLDSAMPAILNAAERSKA